MPPFVDKSAFDGSGIFSGASSPPSASEQASAPKMMPPPIPRVNSASSMMSAASGSLPPPSPSPSQRFRKSAPSPPPSPRPRLASSSSVGSLQSFHQNSVAAAGQGDDGGNRNAYRPTETSQRSLPVTHAEFLNKLQRRIRRSVRKYGDTNTKTMQLYIELGNYFFKLGQTDEAATAYKQAVQSNSQPDAHLATAYLNLGTVYWKSSDIDEALYFLNQALSVHEMVLEQEGKSVHESTTAASVHHQMGLCYALSKDGSKAIASMLEALSIRVRIKDEIAIAKTTDAIGKVYLMQGDYEHAMSYHQQALTSFRAAGVVNTSSTLQNIANVHLEAGNSAAALTVLYEVYKMQKAEDVSSVAKAALHSQTLLMMARLHDESGAMEQAEQFRHEALAAERQACPI